jgi:hypothetical protein
MAEPKLLSVGSELWLLHFSSTNGEGWEARCHGKIEEVDPSLGYHIRGEWYPCGAWPCFAAREDAEVYARAHPPSVGSTK